MSASANAAPASSIAAVGGALGFAIQRHIETAFRAAMHGDRVVLNNDYVRLLTGQPHPFANFAMVTDPADVHATTQAIEPLRTCGAPSAVIYPGPPSREVRQLLDSSDFHAHDPMPAMAVEIERLPDCALPNGCVFSRIDPRIDGAKWAHAFAEGYELPEAVGDAFTPDVAGSSMAADAPLQYFAVRKGGLDGPIVATTMLFLNDGLAGIYAVATVVPERRQGLGAYLTAQALRAAHPLGYRVGVLQASPDGYPVYKRLGFADFGAVPLFVRIPA